MKGGVGDYSACLAAALTDQGAGVTVVTYAEAAVEGERRLPYTVLPRLKSWGYDSWGRLSSIIEAQHPDVVHIQYQTGAYGMHPAINLWPLFMRWARAQPQVVVTFHDLKVPYLFPKAGRLRKWPGAILAFLADALIVTNHEDAATLQAEGVTWDSWRAMARFGRRRMYFIPIGSNIPVRPVNGYERILWRSGLGLQGDVPLLSYFGFLKEDKGVETLLNGLRILLERNRPVNLLMIGGKSGDWDRSNWAYAQRMEAMTQEPALQGRVWWTGFGTVEETSAHLLCSDICVLPFKEGASLRHGTLVAALVHGLPIITTHCPDVAKGSRLDDRNARILPELRLEQKVVMVPPDDPLTLAEAIENLLDSPERRASLSQQASSLAAALSWDSIARKTLEVYAEVMN